MIAGPGDARWPSSACRGSSAGPERNTPGLQEGRPQGHRKGEPGATEGRPRGHRGETQVFEKKVAPGQEGTVTSPAVRLTALDVIQAEEAAGPRAQKWLLASVVPYGQGKASGSHWP